MQYNTIFFDIGNTLCFFNYEFLRDLLKQKYDVSVTTEELEEKHVAMKRSLFEDKCFSMSHNELWVEAYRRWFTSVGMMEEIIKPAIECVGDHPFKHLFWARTEEGTKSMLDWFREHGYKLGVISNAEGQILKLLDHIGITDRFDVVIDSGLVGFAKPDKRIFEKAMMEIGSSPENCIHVGDLLDIDVVGARSVGITPILVDKNGDHIGADCLSVNRVTELPKLSLFTEGE